MLPICAPEATRVRNPHTDRRPPGLCCGKIWAAKVTDTMLTSFCYLSWKILQWVLRKKKNHLYALEIRETFCIMTSHFFVRSYLDVFSFAVGTAFPHYFFFFSIWTIKAQVLFCSDFICFKLCNFPKVFLLRSRELFSNVTSSLPFCQSQWEVSVRSPMDVAVDWFITSA